MKRIIVTVSYPWAGIRDDVEVFFTDFEDMDRITEEAYESALDMIFNNISWNFEVEEGEEE